jgi:uncharacterized protein
MPGTRISIRVAPGARVTAATGRHGRGYRVRVAAPPTDGRANRELVEFLARELGVNQAAVRIVAGRWTRDKLVEVDGVTIAQVEQVLGVG